MLKRTFDVMVSAAGLVLLSPVLVAIAIVIRLTSPGPVIYRATRVGRDGDPFTIYKFRSMIMEADRMGPRVTCAADCRITPVGRFLRKTKLDELPQLLNVLRGDMSIVGPRPEDPRYVALYTPSQREVLKMRPGITSLASVEYRHEENMLCEDDWETQYISDLLPKKLQLDLAYVQNPSLATDLKIIFRTVVAVLGH